MIRTAAAHRAVHHRIDPLAFTGSIRENTPTIRAAIMDGLAPIRPDMDQTATARGDHRLHTAHLSVAAWIVAAQAERTAAAIKVQA